jgi:NAD(P)-dependent dehydrogenase (short-subunit alcohol dehydrogenase family)
MMSNQNLLSLEGLNAVVTGGAGGIGREVATVLAGQGASIVLLDRAPADPERAAVELAKELGGAVISGVAVDISDAESVRAAYTHNSLKKIDILVTAAGIREISPAESLDPVEWAKVVDVNLNGTFYAIRYAIEALKKSDHPAIVNIASVAGLIAMANRPAYSATKHAIVGLTKNLAHDLGQYGIRVNAVAPGTVRTPMTESYYSDEDFLRSMDIMVPLDRLGTATDVANTVLYLASPLAAFISGVVLPVDGGWLAQKNYMPGGGSSAYTSAPTS